VAARLWALGEGDCGVGARIGRHGTGHSVFKAIEPCKAQQAEGDVRGANTANGGGVSIGDVAGKERHPTGGPGASAG